MTHSKHHPPESVTTDNLEYYTTKELAHMLKLSVAMLAELRRKGTGPKYTQIGYRTCRYPKAEVAKYLEKQTRTSTSATRNYDLDF